MKTSLLLCLFTMMIVATVGRAGGVKPWPPVVLDQVYYDPPATVSVELSAANTSLRVQTFTVGIAGTLDHVDIFQSAGSDPPASVRILATSGGVPTNTVVATSNLVSLAGDGWTSFDLLGAGLTVAIGDVLAIEPIRSGYHCWLGGYPGGYAAGSSYFINPRLGFPDWTPQGFDLFFRTFVEEDMPVPVEPATWGRIKADRR